MLSDEEKKEYEELKSLLYTGTISPYGKRKLIEIIEKKSKEIEELKEKNKPQPDCAEPVERTEEMVNMRWVNYNYISKDKIKAKIEELNKDFKEYENGQEWEIQDEIRGQIDVLQSLLEKE